ncbi:MAG TPA: hypothetical protein VHX65_18990 [Pirellulales bacterium]|jgi:hypothetical protein|nr:hypothetical protein [Pirellulales bacterium]
MSTLASEIKASINWLFQEPLALTTVGDASQLSYDDQLANGSAADQADTIWSDQRTVAAGTNDDLDLTNLTHSLFGSTLSINLASVKAIFLVNTSTTSGDTLQLDSSVADACTAPFSGSAASLLQIGADSALLLSSKKDGWAVDSTHKILRVSNTSPDSITYSIVVLGISS